MELAPIIVFTFNRIDHTKKTINALKRNTLAKESEIFIFSDYGRSKEENKRVDDIRKYLKGIEGFKKINIIESKHNKGLAVSVINGVDRIIKQYGKVIVLEDDLVTSKYFLEYMNNALNLYKDRLDIWSISGYSPKLEILDKYEHEVYLSKRASSWGWATWENRWNLTDWQVSDYIDIKNNKRKQSEFNKLGDDCYPMLNEQMNNRLNSWAIRWVYSQFKNDSYTVYPRKSLVINIGTDKSGTNSPKTKKYDVILNDKSVILEKDIIENIEITSEFKKFYDLGFYNKVGLIFRKIGIHKQIKKLFRV